MAINTYPVDGNTQTVYPTELTDEVLARLGAPVPASEIKILPGKGATIRYTTDKFVIHRLNEVVGVAGWQVDYTITTLAKPAEYQGVSTIGQIVCRLKVLGVMKSGSADMEVDPKMYGTPATNGQAKALKRAAMLFGVAAELWDKDAPVTATGDTASRKPAATPAANSTGGSGLASEKQVSYLADVFDVPKSVASKLTGGRDGEASQLITAIKSGTSIKQALLSIGRAELAPLLRGDDEDEDLD
jgi:hypothetical protein